MAAPDPTRELAEIEAKIQALVALVERMQRQIKTLERERLDLKHEQASLVAKNELARTRVESMILRLRALESGA